MNQDFNIKQLISGGLGIVLLLVLVIGGCNSCKLVSPTEAGFKISRSGDYRGVSNLPLITGYNFYIPWLTEIKTIPTTMQHIVWSSDKAEGKPDDQAISVACMGGAGFKIDVGLNYHVNANDAPRIYLRWKETDLDDITSKFIRNLTRGAMQDISGHLTVDSILNNLPAYEGLVRDSLSRHMRSFGFIVDNFNILHRPIPSDPQLEASINAKIKAKQDAETSIMQLQQSIAEANKKMADARGDSASSVIKAAGEAEAIKLKQTQVTPNYIEYIKAQTWDGHLSQVITSGGGMFMNISPK